jgi:hypothetical protein
MRFWGGRIDHGSASRVFLPLAKNGRGCRRIASTLSAPSNPE